MAGIRGESGARDLACRWQQNVALAAFVTLALATAAGAGGPVGDEFAINDRPLPPKQWWTSCTDATGRRATILPTCAGAKCDESYGALYLQRFDADGDEDGPPVIINDEAAWQVGFRVSCSDNGWVAAQFVEGDCYRYRVFDAENDAAGATITPSAPDCRTRPNVAVDDQGRTLAAWPVMTPGSGSDIFVRRYRANGTAVAPAVQVSEDAEGGWRTQPKVAIDDSGIALIVWLGRSESGYGGGPVTGRLLKSNGDVDGAAFRIDTFGFGDNSDPAIARLGDARFEVAWTNFLEGGRVAREVSAGATTAAPAVDAAALAAPQVRFGAPRFVDTFRHGYGYGGHLEAGEQRWIYSDSYSRMLTTTDDSVSWSQYSTIDPSMNDREIPGSNAEGKWLALKTYGSSSDIHVSRSTDDGASWTNLQAFLENPRTGQILDVRVRGEGSTWIASWTTSNATSTAVVFARTTDDGGTWSKPKVVSTDASIGKLGFGLETDGEGTWIAMLVDESVQVIRSTDDGASWSSPDAVVENVACTDCAGAPRFTRIGLDADGDGNWVAVYTGSRQQTGLYGRDGDLFAIRSANDGRDWSAPVSIAPWAAGDGSPDFAPVLARSDDDRWLVTWLSHHPAPDAPGDGLDSDVFWSVSTNLGATWSAPQLLDDSMESDEASDAHVSLADRDGRWLAVWERTPFGGDGSYPTVQDLMVSAADATCGNEEVEVGESCDDGNRADGDACDSNCTDPGCGNGILDEGEACDDGNRDNDDDCNVLCDGTRCGDGVVSSGEECDDGNEDSSDACTSACLNHRCGDSITQPEFEECDSGGAVTSSCTPECLHARCGDGHVAPRAEACDDGNAVDDDACPNDCSKATCGDGYTSIGWEECDPDDPFYENACTDDCLLVGLCGDANGDAEVTTLDARFVLRDAVGLPIRCPRDACDMDASGTVSVVDAHMDLRKAVGLAVEEQCSIGTGVITFWVEDSRRIGAFQIDIDYSSTDGAFAGSGAEVECVPSVPDSTGFLFAFNDRDGEDVLTAGIITLQSFSGRVDLFSCRFEMPEDRAGAHFAVYVVDATDPDGEALSPNPLVGYRLE